MIYFFITLVVVFISLFSWLILREGGLIDRLVEARNVRLENLNATVLNILNEIAKMKGDIVENAASIEGHVGQVTRRLTSLETKNGKEDAKTRQERSLEQLRGEVGSFVKQQTQMR